MRRITIMVAGLGLVVALGAAPVAAGGPPALSFYVDGEVFRTVGTPTDLFGTGAPESSYDRIYALGGDLMNVAESKPGDHNYNGGRWLVLPVTWNITPVQLKSAEEVAAYEDAGWLTIGDPVKSFVCPVIPVGGRG